MPTTNTLQELIVAAHLQAPIAFTVADLADWTQLFAGDYPIVQEIPPLPPARLAVGAQPQMHFQMVTPDHVPHPRMLLRSPDGRFSVQLQNDRFGFGWHRTEPLGEPSEYPGFDEIVRAWENALEQFEKWMQVRFHQSPSYGLIEMTYNNAAPFEHQGRKKKISEIFKFVQPGSRPLNGFMTAWTESLEGGPSVAQITAQVNLGSAPPDTAVLVFVFSGLGSVAKGRDRRQMLNDLHGRIRHMYESAISNDVR